MASAMFNMAFMLDDIGRQAGYRMACAASGDRVPCVSLVSLDCNSLLRPAPFFSLAWYACAFEIGE